MLKYWSLLKKLTLRENKAHDNHLKKGIQNNPEKAQKGLFIPGLDFPKPMAYSLTRRLEKKMKEVLKKAGVKVALPSPYDRFMLKMHNFLKENRDFQKSCPKDHWEFPPRSCWVVFTDMVSHAALSGQYALEQTFLVPEEGLLYPEQSPVSILEQLTGQNMVDVEYSAALFRETVEKRPV